MAQGRHPRLRAEKTLLTGSRGVSSESYLPLFFFLCPSAGMLSYLKFLMCYTGFLHVFPT